MQYTISFNDVHYLEDGIISDNLLKVLKSVTSKEQVKKIVQYFKIDKQKLLKILARIKRVSSSLYENVFEHLRTPERFGLTAIGERKAPALAVIIAWLVIEVIMIPLSVGIVTGVGEHLKQRPTQEVNIEQLKAEVDEVVEQSRDVTVDTLPQKTKATKKRSKWSRYTDPGMFITIVKAFEAGDPKTPLGTATPLKAYPDRTQQSIGFGTRAKPNETVISVKEANKRLTSELEYNRNKVKEMLKQKGWSLNNIQINGLTDFAFNRGDSALRQMIVKAKSIEDLSKDILSTTFITNNKGEKVHSKTIADRREWEVAMLMSK